MTSSSSIAATPNTRLILGSLLRADFIVFLKNRRSLIMSILLPYLILESTNSKTSTANLGGPLFVIGLSITYGIASTSIMGYSLATARDREKGVFQRLRVTPASTGAIMGSRLIVQILANLVIALVVVVLGARVHHLSLIRRPVRTGSPRLHPGRHHVLVHRSGAGRFGEVLRDGQLHCALALHRPHIAWAPRPGRYARPPVGHRGPNGARWARS